MTKKKLLLISLIGTALIFTQFLFDSKSCGGDKLCNSIGDVLNQDNLTLIYIMPFVLFFSLITYKMKEEVFQVWWRFTRWLVPVIVVITLFLNNLGGGGGFGIPDLGSVIMIIPLYILFVSISSVRIGVALYEARKNRKVPFFISIFLAILVAAATLFILWQVAASL